MTTTLKTGLNTYQPLCMATAPDGVLYGHNGLDRPIRWDGRTSTSQDSGIDAPTTGLTVASSGSGTIWGDYKIYVRFCDADETASSWSTSAVTSVASGTPVAGFDYTNIPVSSNSRITKRQIWRNTKDQYITWYLDAEINDNSTTTSHTTYTDDQLVARDSLRLLTKDGWPNANRFTPPPRWMSVIVGYADRMWFLVPADYSAGKVTASTTTATASGVRFNTGMIGWKVRASGRTPGRIISITTTTITYSSTSAGLGTVGDYYSVTPTADERNRIYFSEASEPESVPTVNAIDCQDDGDVLTGAAAFAGSLYLFKQRHTYRLSTAGNPRKDANIMPASGRGCINQRCWCRVEDSLFVVDQAGAYMFSGGGAQPISGPVQDYWRSRINWAQQKWFHVAYSHPEETVKFYVAFDSETWPKHALCYHTRLQNWWLEDYEFDIGASAVCPIAGTDRLIVGSESGVQLTNEGIFDGFAYEAAENEEELDSSVTTTVRGTVTGAAATRIEDSAANWDFSGWNSSPETVGAPLVVIHSDGSYETKRISSITGTSIIVQTSFDVTPSVGDTYQIGGIPYEAIFGAFEILENERHNVRSVRVGYQPLEQDGTLNVSAYYNHSETARTLGHIPYDSDTGLSIARSSENAVIDLEKTEGVSPSVDVSGHMEGGTPADRFITIKLSGVTGRQKPKIYFVDVDGVES